LCNRKGKKRRKKSSNYNTKEYPNTVFNELLRKEKGRKNGDDKRVTDYKIVVTVPYIAGLSEAIRREGEKVGTKTVFAANDTLKKRLTHFKPKGENKRKT
jgi:hypothetical protein